MNVGIIEAIIRLKDEFSAGVRKAQESFRGLKTSIGTVSTAMKGMATAFAGLAVLTAVKQFADLTGKLTDLSAKTGIGTTELQKLKFMAEQSGGSLDKVTTAVAMMGRNLIRGQEGAVNAVKALGLNFAEVRAMQPDQAFALIADRVAGIQSPMERAAIATEIFGRAGADLLPMFTGNLKAMGDEAERAGLVLDEATVKAGDEFGDALGKLMTAGMALLGNVLSPLLPHMTLLIELFSKVAQVVGVVLTAAFTKAQEVGQKVIEWISGMLGKFLEFAQKIPGVSKVVDRLRQEHEDLGKLTKWLGDQYQALKPKTDTAKAGMEGLRFEIGMTSDETERQAKAFSKSATEIVKRVKDQAEAHHDNRIALFRTLLALQDHIEANRRLLPLLPQLVSHYTTWADRLQILQERLEKTGKLVGEDFAKQADKASEALRIAKERIEQADRELREFVTDLDYLARGLGDNAIGNLVADIANITDAWITATEALARYRSAQSTAGRIGALAAGLGAVAQGTGQGSTLARTVGGALAGLQTGAMVGSFFGPGGTAIGAGVGAAAGALVGLVRGLSQLTGYEQRVRAMAQAFDQIRSEAIRAAGGTSRLAEAAAVVGINIQGAFDSKDPEFLRNVLEDIGTKTAKLNDAMAEYGFTWEDMGERARAARLSEQFDTLFEKTDLLRTAGIDYNEILRRQAGQYSELVQAALRTGTEIPAAMQPVLNDLMAMGLLVDENGQAFTDLSEVSWAKTLTQGFDQVTQAIYDLTDALTNGVGGALDGLSQRRVTIPIDFEMPEVPGIVDPSRHTVDSEHSYATGTHGQYVDFGRGTLAMLHGRERIMTEAEGRSGGGAVTVRVPVHLDGRQITEVVVPNIPAALKRHGLVR